MTVKYHCSWLMVMWPAITLSMRNIRIKKESTNAKTVKYGWKWRNMCDLRCCNRLKTKMKVIVNNELFSKQILTNHSNGISNHSTKSNAGEQPGLKAMTKTNIRRGTKNKYTLCKVKLRFLSKPKFNQNSIELNLRLDYILTERSTNPTPPQTHCSCCC